MRNRAACLISVLLLWQFLAQAAVGAEQDRQSTVLSKRVFFATDRERHGKGRSLSFGKQDTDKLASLTYGVTRADRGWSFNPSDKHRNKDEEPDAIYDDETFKQFTDEVQLSAISSNQSSLLIFVHGCCTSFHSSLKLAAELQAATGVPVILYDWGSPTANYAGSLLACPRSQERFNRFIDNMTAAIPYRKISIVALSLGSELVDGYCMQSRSTARLDSLIFARADLDSVTFSSHFERIRERTRHVYVCSADNDFSTILSSFLRRLSAPTAAGDRVGNLGSGIHSNPTLTVLDISPLNENHNLPCNVIADLINSPNQPVPSAGRYNYSEKPDGTVVVEPR